MDELKMVSELLRPPPPTPEATERARDRLRLVMNDHRGAAAHAPRRPGPTRQPRATKRPRPRATLIGLTALATTVVLASATLVVLRVTHADHVGHAVAGRGPHGSRPTGPVYHTGRAVLMAAARHVKAAPTSGTYWMVKTVEDFHIAGGTRAHPYDIGTPTVISSWLSPRPGHRDWQFVHQLGTSPVTAADRAQWKAAGSPQRWRYGLGVVTTKPSPPGESWQRSNGAVGYIEGDLPYWTLRQFQALPSQPGRLARVLRAFAMQLPSAQDPSTGGATANDLIWGEAEQLLVSPVSLQVRVAAFQVMAALPGIKMVGQVRDPLDRHGYGFIDGGGSNVYSGEMAVIDPNSAALLAIEYLGPPAGLVPGNRADARYAAMMKDECAHKPKSRSLACQRLRWTLHYHRVYPGDVGFTRSYVSAGWTSATPPHLPSASYASGIVGPVG